MAQAIIPELQGQRQEKHEVKSSLAYIVRPYYKSPKPQNNINGKIKFRYRRCEMR